MSLKRNRRHYTELQRHLRVNMVLSLDLPMKYNPKINDEIARLPSFLMFTFKNEHTVQGCLEYII